MNNSKFSDLAKVAMANPNLKNMRPVVEKELLHYDILYALEKEGFLDALVFQGGTSLRLCHGGNRFSEDLDFAGGKDFTSQHLRPIKECIEDYICARYGVDVAVKQPKELRDQPAYNEIKVDKWQIAVTTSPSQRDMPKQKIKLEIANIPAYTSEPSALNINYDFLKEYENTIIITETLEEIMADKLVSLPACQKYVRFRDIWDLAWLQQQGAQINPELIEKKLNDYKIQNYDQLLTSAVQRLPSMVNDKKFLTEMQRFIPADVLERTLEKDKFNLYLQSALGGMFKEVNNELYGKKQSFEFNM